MFLHPTPFIIIFGSFVAIAAGFVKGIGGFGFSVVFTPLCSIIFDNPREVIFVALFLGAIMSFGVIAEVRHEITKDRTIPVVIGTSIGTPIGIVLLGLIDVSTLKLIIASIAIGVTLLRLAQLKIRILAGAKPLTIGALLGGILNGCTSMGGPIPALVVAWQGRGIDESRSILVVFNLLSYLLAIAVALGAGVAQLPWLLSGIWLLPPAAIGTFAGVRAVRHISQKTFAHVITAVVGLAGVAGVLSVLKI
jgi:uncharacterized membrane protein YfcA